MTKHPEMSTETAYALAQDFTPAVFMDERSHAAVVALVPEGPLRSALQDARTLAGQRGVPYGTYVEAQRALGDTPLAELYAGLRRLGVPRSQQAWTLIGLGLHPEATPRPARGYTCHASYSATGEGLHVYHLRVRDAATREAAEAAFAARFFADDPDGLAFYSQGLTVIRGHLPLALPPQAVPGSTRDAFEVHVGD